MTKYFAVSLVLSALIAVVAWADDDFVTLQESKPYVARDSQIQGWSEDVDFGQSHEYKLPITLTFYNGLDDAPGFSWLRIAIAAEPPFTEDSFVGKKTLSIDMSGKLGRGGNQILITGAGPKGATLSWKLTTPKMHVTAVNPQDIGAGEAVVITGDNFSADSSMDVVTFDGRQGEILDASPTQLIAEAPEGLPPGETQVAVAVGRQKSGTVARLAYSGPAWPPIPVQNGPLLRSKKAG